LSLLLFFGAPAQDLTPGLYSDGDTFHSAKVFDDLAWDTANSSGSIAFTNGDSTAEWAADGFGTDAVSVQVMPAGDDELWYFTITINDYTAGNLGFFAMVRPNAFVGAGYYCANGAFENNGGSGSVNLGSAADGDVIDFALWNNAGVYSLWCRRNGGDWNDSPTAEPSTDTGGFTIDTFGTGAPMVVAAALGAGITATATLSYPIPEAQDLTPSLFSDGETFHAATVTRGAVDLTPSLFSDGDTFHSPQVIGPIVWDSSTDTGTNIFTNGDATLEWVAATGTVYSNKAHPDDAELYRFRVTVVDYTDGQQVIGVGVIGDGAYVAWRTNTGNIEDGGTPVADIGTATDGDILDVAVRRTGAGPFGGDGYLAWFRKNGGDWNDSPTDDPETDTGGVVFDVGSGNPLKAIAATITSSNAKFTIEEAPAEAQDLTPSLFSDGETFFTPAVTVGSVDLTPSLFSDGDTFFSATITTGAVDLTPSLFSDGETFFTPSVTVGAVDLTPSLFSDSDSFFSATITTGAVDLTPSLFSDGETFFSATVTTGSVDLTPSLFSDGDSFYSAAIAITVDLDPDLFSDGDTFFSATVTTGSVDLTPSLYSDSDSFYSATITTGSVDLAPSLYSDSDSFHSASVGFVLAPSLYSDSDSFHSATVTSTIDLAPSLYADSDSFHTPTITTGSVDLTPSLYADSDSFYSAAVTTGSVDLAPSLFSDGETFFIATISAGSVDLTPSLFSDGDSFYSSTVNVGVVDLTPSLYSDTDAFFSADITTGAGQLVPSLFEDGDTFHSATITTGSVDLTPSLFSDGDSFHSATVAVGAADLTPSLFSDGDTFFSAAITTGSVDLTPSLFSDGDSFYSATIVSAGIVLSPSLFSDGDIFFTPAITVGSVDLTPSLFSDGDSFYSADVLSVYDLTPSLFSNGDSFYAPAVDHGLRPDLFQDSDEFHQAVLEAGTELLAALYADSDAFYDPTVDSEVALVVPLVPDEDLFHAAVVSYILFPEHFDDGDTFYESQLALGIQHLVAPFLGSGEEFFPTDLVYVPRRWAKTITVDSFLAGSMETTVRRKRLEDLGV
jgi:hypothetical protein